MHCFYAKMKGNDIMSYIPSVRTKTVTSPYMDKDGEKENGYWQGYLDKDNAMFVAGFDFAVKTSADSFFDNIDYLANYDDDAIISVDDINLSLSEFFEKHPNALEAIRRALLDWLEMDRDNLVVSAIDDMEQEEYDCIKKKADSGEYSNILYRFGFEDDPEMCYSEKYDET